MKSSALPECSSGTTASACEALPKGILSLDSSGGGMELTHRENISSSFQSGYDNKSLARSATGSDAISVQVSFIFQKQHRFLT